MEREGVEVSFTQLLSISIFVGNAMTTVGNATPYQVVYGRQPWMLPDIDAPDWPDGESADGRKREDT